MQNIKVNYIPEGHALNLKLWLKKASGIWGKNKLWISYIVFLGAFMVVDFVLINKFMKLVEVLY